jgi:hypothetical protein
MRTVMKPCKREGAVSGVRGKATPSYITTTLHALIGVLQDIMGPDNDPLVVAIVVDLLRSGRLTLVRAAHEGPWQTWTMRGGDSNGGREVAIGVLSRFSLWA